MEERVSMAGTWESRVWERLGARIAMHAHSSLAASLQLFLSDMVPSGWTARFNFLISNQ